MVRSLSSMRALSTASSSTSSGLTRSSSSTLPPRVRRTEISKRSCFSSAFHVVSFSLIVASVVLFVEASSMLMALSWAVVAICSLVRTSSLISASLAAALAASTSPDSASMEANFLLSESSSIEEAWQSDSREILSSLSPWISSLQASIFSLSSSISLSLASWRDHAELSTAASLATVELERRFSNVSLLFSSSTDCFWSSRLLNFWSASWMTVLRASISTVNLDFSFLQLSSFCLILASRGALAILSLTVCFWSLMQVFWSSRNLDLSPADSTLSRSSSAKSIFSSKTISSSASSPSGCCWGCGWVFRLWRALETASFEGAGSGSLMANFPFFKHPLPPVVAKGSLALSPSSSAESPNRIFLLRLSYSPSSSAAASLLILKLVEGAVLAMEVLEVETERADAHLVVVEEVVEEVVDSLAVFLLLPTPPVTLATPPPKPVRRTPPPSALLVAAPAFFLDFHSDSRARRS
mmetsp:Transcript_9925/g.20212  ORF Transcript_9925/g.20212 Transcript_9925/m.20212 type:complete len:469 (-) Transcript_9925:64-1470(-)